MSKAKLKGWLDLLIGGVLLFYAGGVYRANGFGMEMVYTLVLCLAAVPVLFTCAFRRLGTLITWSGMALSLFLLWQTSGNIATSVLVWALCCSIPLAVSFTWPNHLKIKPLAMRALPAAGAVAFGGTLIYNKLHFGGWNFDGMMSRIGDKIGVLVDQMETMYLTLYYQEGVQNPLPEEITAVLTVLREGVDTMAFSMILWVVYALFGLFFLSVYLADRKAGKDGLGRMLGPWYPLIPTRRLSWLYMGAYILVLFFNGVHAQNLTAVFDLFGFLFVFTALYRLLQFFRKKELPPLLRKLLIGALFILSFTTVGGGLLLSPYTVLVYAGWWIATLPIGIHVHIQKK
ncbi:MAG: hypothetical protein IJ407_02760 [Clostridia bacterium]|nr:hypothetical protein [Clostridia bacterium]